MNERHFLLRNQVALVTGAAQGMGATIAETLAQAGAIVFVADICFDKLETVAATIRTAGGRATAIHLDVTQASDVERATNRMINETGRLDILVNNAGILRATRIDDISLEEWKLVLDVNLTGTFLCTKAVLPPMKKQAHGRIINMSSSAGRSVSTLGGAHYTTAKAAVLGFTRAVAKEVAPFGITVNAVCPGLIDTEMVRDNCPPERLRAYEQSFPIPRLGTPLEVARLVFYLATEATYITGASLDINGGDLMI